MWNSFTPWYLTYSRTSQKPVLFLQGDTHLDDVEKKRKKNQRLIAEEIADKLKVTLG